jgi:hypothetical protein
LAPWATGNIYTGQPKHHLLDCFPELVRQLSIGSNEFSQKRDTLLLVNVCQEAKISDFHKPLWQDMQKEAPDKLVGIKGHRFDLIVSLPISIGEGNLAVFDRGDAVV